MNDRIRLKIEHRTRYRFDRPVPFGLQQIRTTPKRNDQQTVLNWTTTVEGGTQELAYDDQHLNHVELVSFASETTELTLTTGGEVEVEDNHGIVGRHRAAAPLWLYRRPTPRTEAGNWVRSLTKGLDGTDVTALHALIGRIRETVAYEVGASQPDWTAEDAIAAGRGVCQDHTHIFLACARSMGLPARYVSGYLMLDDRTDQDAMHAWAEAWVDGLGWVGFDVSNGISPDARYVRVATGLDYAEAAPVSGLRMGAARERLDVAIEVVQQ